MIPHQRRLDIRELLLQTARDQEPDSSGPPLSQNSILDAVYVALGRPSDIDLQQAVLTQWQELFRTGYFAWGLNLNNPNPPFLHITDRGRRALERLTRDPGNPAGYMRHVLSVAKLNPIASSYLTEGLSCYGAGFHKAAAVMLGAAGESLVLELRDTVTARIKRLRQPEVKALGDWRVKTVLDTLQTLLEARRAALPRELRDEFQAYWLAFGQQIRTTRNDAGHPTTVDPVTEEGVHAAFLVFPEQARLQTKLNGWVPRGYR